jgi:hypothetical protein
VVLMTGTLWHSWANEALMGAGLPVMQEVKLTQWMPDGWSGTADWVFYNADLRGFVLGDLKTIKGDGIPWIERDGAKLEHRWQWFAYWCALREASNRSPRLQGRLSGAQSVTLIQKRHRIGRDLPVGRWSRPGLKPAP